MEPVKIREFTADELLSVVEEATKSQTEEAWIEKYLGSVVSLITRKPVSYRAFGAYWWVVRSELEDRSLYPFVEKLDYDLLAQVDLGNTALNLAAAWSYSEFTHNKLSNLSNAFTHAIDDGGDTISYQLWDDELEANIHFK